MIAAVSSPFGQVEGMPEERLRPQARTPIAWSSPKKKRQHNFVPRGAFW